MLNAVASWAQLAPTRTALEEPTGTLSYGALWAASNSLADVLRAEHCRVVALDIPNGSHWVIAHLACLIAQLPQLPLPPFFSAAQRTHAMRDAGADACLRLENGALQLSRYTAAPVVLPFGTALITYTSGSTGQPKGVCLSAEGMAQVAQSLLDVLGEATAARHLSVLPLGVLLEQVGGLYPALMAGGRYIMRAEPLHEALAASEATSCILVPELLKALLPHARPYPALRFAAVGGARVNPQLLDTAAQLGLPVFEGYGLSEAASVVAVNRPGHAKPGTVGNILPHHSYRISADGELILQHVAMLGYAGSSAQPSREFATGDLVSVDSEGYLSIHGRKKNLLITGMGRNISPEWPESLLTAHPAIAQACVHGDADAGLHALIVSTAPDALIERAIAHTNALLPADAPIRDWQRVAPFTVADGLLTGNGRLRRYAILTRYTKDMNDGFLRPACA